MFRKVPPCWRICSSQVRSRLSRRHLKKWMIVALTALSLTANSHSVDSSTVPSLFLPMGSYLKYFNIGGIYFNNGDMYYKAISNEKVHFESTELIPNPESCWSQGYDLKGNGRTLSCDTAIQTPPVKASRFFYSALVPYGSYLSSCTGVLQTRENGRTYLYASCLSRPTRYLFINYPGYTPSKLDITRCRGEIINNQGRLECSKEPSLNNFPICGKFCHECTRGLFVKSENYFGTVPNHRVQTKHILTGSYLESCSLPRSHYDPETNVLHADCPGNIISRLRLTLNDAGSCIGNGKDIALIGRRLICKNDPSREVKQHTASLYLPAGNYLATCRSMIFYPCMGSNNQGLLAAECANNEGRFDLAMLEDGDEKCRMSNLGYVSNTRGELRCDPDITFDNEDPTQGSELLPHFQCNQP